MIYHFILYDIFPMIKTKRSPVARLIVSKTASILSAAELACLPVCCYPQGLGSLSPGRQQDMCDPFTMLKGFEVAVVWLTVESVSRQGFG